MSLPPDNNLSRRHHEGRLCTVLGVKLVFGVEIIGVARAAGYDCIFIDLEHSPFSLQQASQLCQASNMGGISPLVRVPHECGNGFVQRVLDADAKAIVVPHIREKADARRAVEMIKYPPLGIRSINPSLLMGPKGSMTQEESRKVLAAADAVCIIQIETKEAIENLDSIASTPGLDMLLIGSMDVTIELGILADWSNPLYQDLLRKVSAAAQKHGKLWGISGLFTRPDIWTWAVKDLGVSLIVGSLDLGLLTRAAKANVDTLRAAESKALEGLEINGKIQSNGN